MNRTRADRSTYVLPDYLSDDLDAVFCGTAAGATSAKRGRYYAGPGNEFWPLLFEAGITPVLLKPSEDHRVVEYGIGLTDLAKHVAASSDRGLSRDYDVEGLLAKVEHFAHRLWAFPGQRAA